MSLQFSPPDLIRLRTVAHMSRDDLAREAGCSYWAVKTWELGTAVPGGESLAAVATAIGCSIDDLFIEDAGA
jgi:DNA-binding transcriptional regulator YiaG